MAMGLKPRELHALWSKIPDAFRGPFDARLVVIDDLQHGKIPAHGFGFGGDTGGGKTQTIAAWMRLYFLALYKTMPEDVDPNPKARIWSFWPSEVNWFRSAATTEAFPERLEALKTCRLLVLDDLGRERIKGCYTDDWAASQLDEIVNHRNRNMLPIIWTTNVRPEGLVDLYGSAMYSRLTEDNPLVWIDGLVDLRG